MPLDSTLLTEQIANTRACIEFFNQHLRTSYGLFEDVDIEDLTEEELNSQPIAGTVLEPMAIVIHGRTGAEIKTVGDVMRATGLAPLRIDEIACDCGVEGETTSSEFAAAFLTEHWDRLEGN